MKNCFVSWSGGKDALFALYTAQQENPQITPTLLNMCDADQQKSRSHGISAELLRRQAEALNLPLHQASIDERGYEVVFKEAINHLKTTKEVTHGIFGDLYLWAHRDWVERVCAECDIIPLFPLWEVDTTQIVTDFVAAGFKTLLVAVHDEKLDKKFLGTTIDKQFCASLPTEVDPCGELGEFHTFVYDGPLFNQPVSFTRGAVTFADKHHLLELK